MSAAVPYIAIGVMDVRGCSTAKKLRSLNADRILGVVGAAGLEPATR